MAGLLDKLRKSAGAATTGATAAQTALDELRALRLRLLDERADVESRPIPLNQAADAAAAAIQRRAERALDDLYFAPLMRPDARGPRLDLRPEDAADLALAAAADHVAGAIRDRLAAAYAGGPEPMDRETQAAELARIDAAILDAELAEEATIRDLEATGLAVLRRPDADPRALLAADEALAR